MPHRPRCSHLLRRASLRDPVRVEAARAVHALSSALASYDGLRSARLPANLLAAQRDYFGAHRYQRVDRAGSFHTDWIAQ